MNIIGIIPARMASMRFPGKPLAKILGIPMIAHVYHRSKMCSLLDSVWVATCDQEIVDFIESIGGKAVMTADTHERASDRVAEAFQIIEKTSGKKSDIIVMIQGDEAMVKPEMIDSAITSIISDPEVQVSNLMAKMNTIEEHKDANEVKVVVDTNNNALYFSREPIPSRKKYNKMFTMLKQVCIIPFRRECLLKFSQLKPAPLEIIESVDMNRFLEYGIKVKMVETEYISYTVDTPEDLIKVAKLMKQDLLVKDYL